MMKKRIVSILLTGILALSLAGCGGKEQPAAAGQTAEEPAGTAGAEDVLGTDSGEETDGGTEISEQTENAVAMDGRLIVGFDQDFPPMGFVGDDGEYTGFDLELAEEVANRLGLDFQPQPIAWDAKDMELSSGTIDCIWNGFTMNGREEDYTWTEPYMDNQQVFVVRADSGIQTQADLAGRIVEVQADSSAETALKDLPDLTASFGTLQTTPDYNTAFMDLEMGAVDAIAMDVIVAGYQIENREDKENYVILEESLSSEKYGVGFLLGNEELRDKVQGALEEMAEDGTLTAISEKWFGVDVTTIGK